MPAATIDVDPEVYSSAGDVFLQVNDAVCDLVSAAATAAGRGGGMAGTDSGGVDWAKGYDDAATAALTAGATLADSLGHLGELLCCSGDNHAGADASSTPGGRGGPPAYPGSGAAPGAVSIIPASPPSANGTDDDPPAGWFLVAHLLQYTWPNGHQDRLRAVASGWQDGATRLTEAADRLTGPIGDISALTSPEVDAAVTTCCDVQQSARSLADSFTTLSTACDDYAEHLDQAHSEVISELVEFAAQSAGVQLLSAVAAPFTAGAGELAGQAAQAARTALAASRIGRILEKLIDVVRTVTATIRAVATRIAEVLTKVKAVLAKGGAKAVEEAAPALQKTASVDIRKFSEYVFRGDGCGGKERVFTEYGYTGADAARLTEIFESQAAKKFATGDYTLGTASEYGQRITINIDIPGKGAAAGSTLSVKSGWMIRPDGSITLNTPFGGYVR